MPSPTLGQPSATLRAPARVVDVAERSRRAGLLFVNEAATWDKPELVGWLLGPYYAATNLEGGTHRSTSRVRRVDTVETGTLESILTSARVRVLSTLEAAALARGPVAIVDVVRARGFIRPISDHDGNNGWAPLDLARMRLADRVIALFAADANTRPSDYASGLAVCHLCERVRIDAATRDAPCECERVPLTR